MGLKICIVMKRKSHLSGGNGNEEGIGLSYRVSVYNMFQHYS